MNNQNHSTAANQHAVVKCEQGKTNPPIHQQVSAAEMAAIMLFNADRRFTITE